MSFPISQPFFLIRAPLAELWYKTNDLDEELSMSANYSVQLPDPWGGGGLGVRNWPHGSSANLSESRVWKPTLTSLWAKPRSGSADTFEAILVRPDLRTPPPQQKSMWLQFTSQGLPY